MFIVSRYHIYVFIHLKLIIQGLEIHFMKKSLVLNEDRFSVSLHLDSCAESYHLCNLGLRTSLYYYKYIHH